MGRERMHLVPWLDWSAHERVLCTHAYGAWFQEELSGCCDMRIAHPWLPC